MATNSGALDQWRNYFRTANSDIFGIIEHAILVAASDCPKEFRLRRDRIAEKLFSCKLTRCFGCDRVELAVPENDGGGCKIEFDMDACQFEAGGSGSKESKVNSSSKESKANSIREDHGEMNMNQVSNYSYGEAEALTDEIEEETQIAGEVLRIREILEHSKDESDSVLFDSLRRLQLMVLSVDNLKATEIGKAVNGLRKHGSKQIRQLARTLIDEWKDMVDEWVNATAAIAEGTPDSVNPSVVDDDDDEEGLPFPPMDELSFLTTQPTSLELSQFFDGMDDDGNPRNNGEFNRNRENGRKPALENQNISKRKQQLPDEANGVTKDKGQQIKKQEPVVKSNKPINTQSGFGRPQEILVRPNRPSNTDSGPGRPPKPGVGQKVNNETKFLQKSDKPAIQRKPVVGQQDKSKSSEEDTIQVKLEAAKRKLHERYQQAEDAKRQRTIQVMELQDLPKQGLGHRNPHIRHGNNNRHWANGRR